MLGEQVGEMGVVVFVQEGVDETSGVFEGGGVGGGAGGGERETYSSAATWPRTSRALEATAATP